MIIYQASKSQFLHHALRDDIEDIVSRQFRSATGHGVGPSEIQAWKHSLLEMAKVLQDEEIPDDAGVAIEYQLPQTSKRIDFVITGEDAAARTKVIIVELKQWSRVAPQREGRHRVGAPRRPRGRDARGRTRRTRPGRTPPTCEDFNAAVQDGAMTLQPCAYLHNHPRDGEIDHPHYREHIARAPLFLARERAKLQAFIREHVRHGDRRARCTRSRTGASGRRRCWSTAWPGCCRASPSSC